VVTKLTSMANRASVNASMGATLGTAGAGVGGAGSAQLGGASVVDDATVKERALRVALGWRSGPSAPWSGRSSTPTLGLTVRNPRAEEGGPQGGRRRQGSERRPVAGGKSPWRTTGEERGRLR
jgi:hypothetical protein